MSTIEIISLILRTIQIVLTVIRIIIDISKRKKSKDK